jgi:hypothetical protein
MVSAAEELGFYSLQGQGIFLSFSQRPTRLWGPLSLLSSEYQWLFPSVVKRQEHDIDHSPTYSDELKNTRAILQLPCTP